MIVRSFNPTDDIKLREIHALFYADEFEFPNFLKNFLCAFVIEDDNNNIITAGGIRLIPEVQLLTDKRFTIKKRVRALNRVLQICNYICSKHDYTFFTAAAKDENWLHALLKSGFRLSNGQSVVFDIR